MSEGYLKGRGYSKFIEEFKKEGSGKILFDKTNNEFSIGCVKINLYQESNAPSYTFSRLIHDIKLCFSSEYKTNFDSTINQVALACIGAKKDSQPEPEREVKKDESEEVTAKMDSGLGKPKVQAQTTLQSNKLESDFYSRLDESEKKLYQIIINQPCADPKDCALLADKILSLVQGNLAEGDTVPFKTEVDENTKIFKLIINTKKEQIKSIANLGKISLKVTVRKKIELTYHQSSGQWRITSGIR